MTGGSVLSAAIFALAATSVPDLQVPDPTTLRYDEDWSILAKAETRTGRWTEEFKYIPLDWNGSIYLTTGLEVRARNENYRNNLWGDAASSDDSYIWTRLLPYADLHVGNVRAFVQPIVARASSVANGPGPVDQTGTDLLQVFGELSLSLSASTLTLRGGRQMVSLGSERLVGTRYGPNVPRAFDGIRAILRYGDLSASALYLHPVRPGLQSFDDRTNPDEALWGLYTTVKAGSDILDLYWLANRNSTASYFQGNARSIRHTIGVRWAGERGALGWNVEAMGQIGRFGNDHIRAWSIASETTLRLSDTSLSPMLLTRLNYISGDASPRDHVLGSFAALYPKGQYFGELSPLGPANLINAHFGLRTTPAPDVTAGVAVMAYWRAKKGDGIYDIPGHLLRAPTPGAARFVGKQAEATLAWQATPELSLSGSLSAFLAGEFLRDTGRHRIIAMAAIEAGFKF